MFTASPPWMRPRLIDGRSNRGADSPANGRVSMRRKRSIARRTAFSPSHGVEPWAAVPGTSTRRSSTPFACTPTRMSVGSPHTTKSALSPSRTSIWVQFSPGSARSSSGTTISSTCAPASEPRRSVVASIIAARAAFMS